MSQLTNKTTERSANWQAVRGYIDDIVTEQRIYLDDKFEQAGDQSTIDQAAMFNEIRKMLANYLPEHEDACSSLCHTVASLIVTMATILDVS